MSRVLNILQVYDHLGWEGSRMRGVKRLFSWVIVSLVSLLQADLSFLTSGISA